MRFFKLIFTALILLLNSFALYSQEELSVDEIVKLFPEEKAVYINKSEHIKIETKKNHYSVKTEIVEDIIYLSERASAYASNAMYFGSFTEINNVEAYSLIPKNKPGKYSKSKVTYFETKDAQSSGIFFDDQKKITFDFEGIKRGTKSHLSYTEIHKDPKLLGRNFFVYGLSALKSEIAVSFPDNVEIGYKVFNVDSSKISFVKTKKGKINTYKWTAQNLKGSEFFNDAPNFSYYTPHVVMYIKKIQLKDSVVTVLPDVASLYNWYYSLVEDVNKTDNEVLKAVVDSLLQGEESQDEKARKIFNWVQDNIKYVAFEDGMGGFIPRQAATVCQRRYGDCKDMASIITDMLRYGGVKGSLTWIGSREIPYAYSEVHTPSVDNHMIASYRNLNNEVVFLDAVGSYTPYGYPTAFIQGKEALISLGKDSFEIHQVPIVKKERNLMTDVIKLRIDGTELKGNGEINAIGYSKLDFVYPLLNKSDEKRKEHFNTMIEKGNNKFLIDKIEFDGIADRDKTLKVNYDFTVGDYINVNKDEIYLNMHLDKALKSAKIDIEKRKGIAVAHEYLQDVRMEVELLVPNGYKVSYIPNKEFFKEEGFGFDLSYKEEGGKLVLSFNFYRTKLFIESSDFENWNKMVKKASQAYKEVVILKKK